MRVDQIRIEERAHVFGGDVTIRGGPGEGTTVKATVPLTQGADHK